MKVKVAVVGGTGYGAVELIRLINQHPYLELVQVVSHSQSGKSLSDIFPHLQSEFINIQFNAWDIHNLSENVELIFFATPAGVTKELIPQCIENNITCIDLSGDFRLQQPDLYEQWYKKTPAKQELLMEATYGLTEIYEQEIKHSRLIANPGCYPTATLLGLIPIVKQGWVEPNSIIIDGKSGVSGAGRTVSLQTHFSETNENVKAYKLCVHQHIPEIEQTLRNEGKHYFNITFTTHLIPMTRGIMCTIYCRLNIKKNTKEILDYYHEFYENHPFVRIRPEGMYPSTKEVYGSNYCDIGIYSDERTGTLTIISVIDNLMKGAAGQAIQNVNIMNGWNVTTGLTGFPIYP